MIISHAHRFAILAPWKTASSTLHARFEALNESPYSRFYYFSPHLNRVTHQHIGCAEFSAYPESRLGYTTAAFVRNPYDRVYSGFIQVQRDLKSQIDAPYPAPWIKKLSLKQLAENHARLIAADYDFDRWVAHLPEDRIRAVGVNTGFPLHPAHYWTHLCGERYVSFVGKVENFEADLADFCAKVGVPVPPAIDRNFSGSSVAPMGTYRYASAMNAASIDKIGALFDEDFRLFGYPKIER